MNLISLFALSTLLLGASSVGAQTLVGQPIADEKRTLRAWTRQIECEQPAGDARRLDGRVRGQAFRVYTMNCNFVGGNAQWAAMMIGFHDGQRYTRVVAFAGGLSPTSSPTLRDGRLGYDALVAKPDDARCCPSGKARVEIDMATLVRSTRTIGFRGNFPPERAQALR